MLSKVLRSQSQGIGKKIVQRNSKSMAAQKVPGFNFSINHAKRQGAFKQTQAMLKPMSGQTESFLNGTSAVYVDYAYEQWKTDPTSVHASW